MHMAKGFVAVDMFDAEPEDRLPRCAAVGAVATVVLAVGVITYEFVWQNRGSL